MKSRGSVGVGRVVVVPIEIDTLVKRSSMGVFKIFIFFIHLSVVVRINQKGPPSLFGPKSC